MIIIHKPEIVLLNNRSRLQTTIDIDGDEKSLWFEVDNKYGEYLCYERSDAFVIALLSYAMREGHDITCLAPMGEELYYQITTYLIDSLYKGSSSLYNTKIISDIDLTTLANAGGVGTGISAGIDSFHSISEHVGTIFDNHNITHLAFNNVGSHGEGERAVRIYKGRLEAARSFALEYGFDLVESNSNLHDQITQSHVLTHTYSSCFSIYCLQKLYKRYYYSSAASFLEFSLKNNERYPTDNYDLLSLSMFSTSKIRLISEGGNLSRLEKTKKVVLYKPSYQYLNVCTYSVKNCSKCEKCTRTLVALDALNSLEKYHAVFDIHYYKEHRQEYYITLVSEKIKGNINYVEVYPYLKDKISLMTHIRGLLKVFRIIASSIIPDDVKKPIRKIIKACEK